MGLLLFLPRLASVVLWVGLGLLSVIFVFPWASLAVRSSMNRWWSRCLVWLCGVTVRYQGEPYMDGPILWVANHVSWIDIFILNSMRPTAFVAKSDIRKWPVLGWLVAGAGTVFIERGNRRVIRSVGEQMRKRFDGGEVVGLFPEGTTSSGLDVGPFHSSLFDAAIGAGIDIQPVALRFYHRGERSAYAAFVGEQNLLQNVWCLLSTMKVLVEVSYLPVMPHAWCEQEGRSKVAARAHRAIRSAVVAASS